MKLVLMSGQRLGLLQSGNENSPQSLQHLTPSSMAAAVGVHFGHTSACVAISKDGRTDILANDAGDRVTPCVVAFCGKDKLVGLPAKQGVIRNSSNTVEGVKRIVGLEFSDDRVQEQGRLSTCKIVDKAGCPHYDIEWNGKRKLVPSKEIVIAVYKKMLETCQAHSGSSIKDAVIAAPLHFTDEQISALRNAAEEAGFHVLSCISEASAAALAFGLGQCDRSQDSFVLIYRLGGLSMDVTAMSVSGGMYRVLAAESKFGLGGNKFDDALVEHLAQEFKRQWKSDLTENVRAMAKLRQAAELCKHVLSMRDSATCSVDSLYDGIDFQHLVSRARFESLNSSLFEQCLLPVETVLNAAGLQKEDISKVILVGGSTRTPRIQQSLRDAFPTAEFCQGVSPEEVTAYGAAIEASLLQGHKESTADETEGVECTSRALLVKVEGSDSHLKLVVPKFTPIPLRRTHNFTTTCDNQESVSLCTYESDTVSDDVKQANLLAKVVLSGLPPLPKGGLKIAATFHIKRDGSLHVHLVEKTSGRAENVTVEAG